MKASAAIEEVRIIKPGRGGARAGAGRKPADYVKPQQAIDYETARARKEAALADLNELEYKIKSGQYVHRDAVRQAGATLMATLVQTLRSVGDGLERKGVPVEVCTAVEQVISQVLADTGEELAKRFGHTSDEDDDGIVDAAVYENPNSDLF